MVSFYIAANYQTTTESMAHKANARKQRSTMGNRLLGARERRGLTQRAAAEAIGITQPSLSAIESDKNGPSTRNLSKLARLYGVSTDYLVFGDAAA